jgi:hypothetical protein
MPGLRVLEMLSSGLLYHLVYFPTHCSNPSSRTHRIADIIPRISPFPSPHVLSLPSSHMSGLNSRLEDASVLPRTSLSKHQCVPNSLHFECISMKPGRSARASSDRAVGGRWCIWMFFSLTPTYAMLFWFSRIHRVSLSLFG